MRFDPDTVPSTIDEAIDTMFEWLTERDKETFEIDIVELHMSFGMTMRNAWSLHDSNTPIVIDFRNRFNLFGMGDDVFSMICAGVIAKIRGEDRDQALHNHSQRLRSHWLKMKINPQTGEFL